MNEHFLEDNIDDSDIFSLIENLPAPMTLDVFLAEATGVEMIYFPVDWQTKIPTVKGWQTLEQSVYDEKAQAYGIQCGERSGVFVIDIDDKDNGMEIWAEATRKLGYNDPLESCNCVCKTGGGGLHLYYTYDEKVEKFRNATKLKINGSPAGVDIRTTGGYVVSPFSKHPSGNIYYLEGSVYDIDSIPDDILGLISDRIAPAEPTQTNNKNVNNNKYYPKGNLLVLL